MEIAAKLRLAMKKADITTEELTDKFNMINDKKKIFSKPITPSKIADYVNGKAIPNEKTLSILEICLDVTPTFFSSDFNFDSVNGNENIIVAALYNDSDKISEEKRKKILDFAKMLTQEYDEN